MLYALRKTTLLTTLAACGWLAISACSGTSDTSQDSGVITAGGSTSASGGSTTSAGQSGVGGTSTTGGTRNTGGSVSTGGSKAAGGTLGTGGVTQVASCPVTPPTQGDGCASSSLSCFYDQCPNTGRTQATCDSSGKWAVTTAACGTVSCTGYVTAYTCPSGDYCRVSAGGAIFASCLPNNCGNGAITAQCLGAYGCNITTSLTQGVSVYCNTCPPGAGGCA